ncbi:MAG TPA: acetoacetate decarboxylase family protein, partial [Pseudomonadales bacterium]|nr:acetoacetate decarboxylase family protein [Pseudomonadales bacterium]
MNADVQPTTAEIIYSPEGSGIPSVIKAPAPWQLSGDGFIATFWLPEQLDDNATFTPDTLKGRRSGKLATMMFVNYHTSDVGPYQELLFIPGQFKIKGKNRRSITKIYVNTWESVVNGNINWGIPKEQADFKVEALKGVTTVQLSQSGHLFAEFKFKEMGLKMPVSTRLVP